jgi:WD40 repeat protein
MVSVDNGSPSPLLIFWDIEEGVRVSSLKPLLKSVSTLSFSTTSKEIAFVGLDKANRTQLSVWNIDKILNNPSGEDVNVYALIAKQTSEFSILKMMFVPHESKSLISCGSENIRLWRVKNSHISGRPVLLGEYSRGHSFSDVAFDGSNLNSLGDSLKGTSEFVYAASNKGLVLKFHYGTAQVLCAFQLHDSPISCFKVFNGFAVSAAVDNRLRIWPLDFGDFLLEARHEGVVTSINASKDFSKLLVGTTSGTLGVLDVAKHR